MATFTYTNSSGLTIADNSVVSQSVNVGAFSGFITSVSVTLTGLSHTYLGALDILLVAPDGRRNFEFLSDVGDNGADLSGTLQDLTFSDAGTLPISDFLTGTYLPTDLGGLEDDGSFGTSTGGILSTATGDTFASAFSGADSGNWQLFIVDDDAFSDSGSLTSWLITIATSDTLMGTGGDDVLLAVANDANSGSFLLNGTDAVDYSGVPRFAFDGDAGDDYVLATSAGDWIIGGAGRDTILTGFGDDTVYVAVGDDAAGETYNGGPGSADSLIFGPGSNTALGGTFDLRDDSVSGFEYWTISDAFTADAAVTLRLNSQQLASTTIIDAGSDAANTIEITMTPGAGTLDLGAYSISDMTGSDDKFVVIGDNAMGETIKGSSGRDSILGNGGDDTLRGNGGADTLRGGANDDTIRISHTNPGSEGRP